MRKQFYFLLILLLTLSTACNTKKNKERIILTNISGELNDVLVVMENISWNNSSGKALKSVLQDEYFGLPQYEPCFKTIQIEHVNFTNIFQLYRNIIDVNINNNVGSSKIWYGNDVFARPQAYLKIEAKNSLEFIELVNKNAEKIKSFFKNAEIERLQSSYKNRFSEDIMKRVKEKYNFRVEIPANYKLESDTNQFSWIAFETPELSQGIFIYSYPYQDTAQFSKGNLLKAKNYYLKKYVPGPRKNTYMTTQDLYPVRRTSKVNKNGMYTVVLEGLWHVEGDFMGGPFISYFFVDKKQENIICLDAYVYGPKKDKRNFIMQLEAIVKTARYK